MTSEKKKKFIKVNLIDPFDYYLGKTLSGLTSNPDFSDTSNEQLARIACDITEFVLIERIRRKEN